MKILHLFANWKWTGPAEPALAVAQVQCADHDVLFVSGSSPGGSPSKILPYIEARQVPTLDGFHLSKHARFRANREDVRSAIELLKRFQPDIVHTHLDNDHRIASQAVRATGIGCLVRTSYDPVGLSGTMRTRRIVRRSLDGLIVTTNSGWDGTLAAYGGSSRSVSVRGYPVPMVLIENGIDLVRFDASRFDRTEQRKKMGLADDEVAIGIVARVQPHRRFDLLLAAMQRVVADHPQLRLVVIGRGTHIQRLLLDPIEAMGLSDYVRSTGYIEGDNYPGALCALDGTLFLVPGTDGTCRALREQMALGLPPIVTPRTPLPEIVEEGTSGLVVEETVDGMARGLARLAGADGLRQRLGAGALKAARQRFDTGIQAQLVTEFYGQVLDEVAKRKARAAASAKARSQEPV
ncbi:MAG: glycosyltransferase involved in cell wall biosynthesis [Pseudohongiellaceae bacterium]